MTMLDADRLLRLRHLARRGGAARRATGLPGGLVTRQRGRGLELAELRAFAVGDDPRHIDRNATARTGRLQVRTFHAERDATTLLLADLRPAMLWGTRRTFRSVAGAEALALAGWRAAGEGGRVGALALTADGIAYARPRAGDRGMIAVAGLLARAHAAAELQADAPDPDLAELVEAAGRLAPHGAVAILASGFDCPGDGFADTVRALARRAELRLLRVADAFEAGAPPGLYRVLSGSGPRALRRGAGALGTPAAIRDLGLEVSVWRTEIPPERQIAHA